MSESDNVRIEVMSESDMSEPPKKWNPKNMKSQENEIWRKIKSKNFRTQSMSVWDNIRT